MLPVTSRSVPALTTTKKIELSMCIDHLECSKHFLWCQITGRGRGCGPFFFFQVKKKIFLLHCVPLYVCRLCINYQGLGSNLGTTLRNATHATRASEAC